MTASVAGSGAKQRQTGAADKKVNRLGRAQPAPTTTLSWPPMGDETTWLTPAAYQRLREELEYLTTEGRQQISERIAEARSHGDIRENADYDAAKNEQGMMEARIRQLHRLLEDAEVREPEDTGTVTVGSVVRVIDADGDTMEFLVAASENRVAGYTLASPESPLGSALLGTQVGDQTSYEAPGGSFTVKIVDVRPFEP